MPTPAEQKRRVHEAQDVLEQLGLPPKQQNVRTALVLLSMVDLKADEPWSYVRSNVLGITESMTWMAEQPQCSEGS